MKEFVLFGAGTIGGVVARELNGRVVCFADNDERKWGSVVEGIQVFSPAEAQAMAPEAKWIATALRTPFRTELQAQIDAMGVQSISTWEFMARPYSAPSNQVAGELIHLAADEETVRVLLDQYEFRTHYDLSKQRPMSDITNVYFEDFFTHRDDEVFVDLGACDGDTIREFRKRWSSFDSISAFEPDPGNYEKLCEDSDYKVNPFNNAVGDAVKDVQFTATGDQTSHISSNGNSCIRCVTLDAIFTEDNAPTFIKMDIEGAELEALWGARRILRDHSPVLAICAYHTSDHLWQIPLLIHAIQPEYKLYLRRYLEATWELVFYAVPPERVK